MVGDPGNHSVGVVQTFGGAKGKFVDPPRARGSTRRAQTRHPAAVPDRRQGQLHLRDRRVRDDREPVRHVPEHGRPARQESPPSLHRQHEPHGVAEVRLGQLLIQRPTSQHYAVAYPEWAQKPFNFANFRRAARFVNSLSNGKVLSKTSSSSGAFKYVTYKVRLSTGDREGHVRHEQARRRREPSRRGSCCPATTSGSRPPTTTPRAAAPTRTGHTRPAPSIPRTLQYWTPDRGCRQRGTQPLSTYNPNDPNSSGTPRLATRPGPDLVPVPGRTQLRSFSRRISRRASTCKALHGQRQHGRPGQDHLPLGHL